MSEIHEHLDRLIKRAADHKAEALAKEAQEYGDDGTSPATTGDQAEDQIAAQKKTYPENAADVGADDNKPGASVTQSTDGATAASTGGQDGTEGSELASGGIGDADNGPKDTDSPDNNGFDSGAFKGAAEALRKQAGELREAANALLTPLDRFLVKSARASEDEEMKKVAMAMPDDELAAASSDALTGQIEGGDITDEEAADILQEALDAGAITEEDIAEAAKAVAAASAAPEEEAGVPAPMPPEGAVEEEIVEQGMPPAPAPDMTGVPASEPVGEDALLGAKMAAADIGPDSPQYFQKLSSFYSDDINEGYAFGLKLAQEIAESYEEEEEEEKEKDEGEGGEGGEDPHAAALARKDGEGEEGGEDPHAAALARKEGEGNGEPSLENLAGDQMSEEQMLTAQTPEEEQALQAVQESLGIDDAQMAELMAAPLPPEAKMAMAKTASALKDSGVDPTVRFRTIILNKVAALRQ